ncbi:hypothetical protein [Deinococcus sp. UYEF24]
MRRRLKGQGRQPQLRRQPVRAAPLAPVRHLQAGSRGVWKERRLKATVRSA